MTFRPLGVRARMVAAMMLLAGVSVVVSAVVINRAVDSELEELAQRDLRFSATDAADVAASAYLEAGGWSERPVRALRTIARARGDEVVVLGADGRPVIGSPGTLAQWTEGERAPIMVGRRQVGTILANHLRTAGVDTAAERLDRRLRGRMSELLVEAGIVAGALALLLALVIALHLSRPLQRLTDVAGRIGAGELETRAAGSGGGREITRLAQTLDRLAAALRHQDELRRDTVADVTHELRGALVGVFARLEALRDGLVDSDVALAQIHGDAHRLRRLVDDVDRLAEAQRPGLLVQMRPIDLDGIVHASVAGYSDRCRALSIDLTHRVSCARVMADPERLGQVVDNLLSNAVRYTDSGGRIAVRLASRGREAVLEVADSGIGIAPEHVAKIFDRFWRSPEARARAGDGSGVGLALLSELVRMHDGRIEVASEPRRGTTFSVFLPLSARPAPPSRGPVPAAVPDIWRRRGELGPASARPDAPVAG